MHSGYDGHGRALRTGRIVFREQVRSHHKLVRYRLDFRKVASWPTPLAFADAVADVDGEISVEVENLMVGLFPNLRYESP